MENLNTNAKEVKVKRARKTAAVVAADAPAPLATSTLIGDKGKKQVQSSLVAMPLDNVKASTLVIESDPINDRNKSGKKFGGMLVTEAAHLVLATGEQSGSKWMDLYTKGLITPAGSVVTTTQSIGDGKRKQTHVPICALAVPKVNKADLAKGAHPINNSNLSGKKLGSMVADETGAVYVALGSDWNDVWFGVTPITPAGAPTSNVSNITGQKAKSVQSVVASVDIPVVKATDVASATNVINHAAISGKRLGSMVVTEAGEILVAKGDKPTDAWVAQFAKSEVTPV